MRATGIIRKIDEVGRIVIPVELREKFNLEIGDGVEFYIDNFSLIIKKHSPNCTFCNQTKELISFQNKLVCKKCAKDIFELNEKKQFIDSAVDNLK